MTVFQHDGEQRHHADGEPMSAEECIQEAMWWGMVPVEPQRRWLCSAIDGADAFCNPNKQGQGDDCDSACGWYLIVREVTDD